MLETSACRRYAGTFLRWLKHWSPSQVGEELEPSSGRQNAGYFHKQEQCTPKLKREKHLNCPPAEETLKTSSKGGKARIFLRRDKPWKVPQVGETLEPSSCERNGGNFHKQELYGTLLSWEKAWKFHQVGEMLEPPSGGKRLEPSSSGRNVGNFHKKEQCGPLLRQEKCWSLPQAGETLEPSSGGRNTGALPQVQETLESSSVARNVVDFHKQEQFGNLRWEKC